MNICEDETTLNLNKLLFELYDGIVQNGPFKGMITLNESSWDLLSAGLKLVGGYEREIATDIEKAISRRPFHIVNVGCAEGYYAIGMALALPRCSVTAIDTDPKSIDLLRKAAALNKVENQIIVSKSYFPHNADLIIMDCEGCEISLLNHIDQLHNTDLIIETHDFVVDGITNKLCESLRHTHSIDIVSSDNDLKVEIMMEDGTKYFMEEHRPEPAKWLIAWKRDRSW